MAKTTKTTKTTKAVEVVSDAKVVKNPTNFAEVAAVYVGEAVAVMCARYQYRGVLSAVTDDCIVLAQPRSVEISGSANADKPSAEDPIPSSVIIKSDAIEILYQPAWAGLDLNFDK